MGLRTWLGLKKTEAIDQLPTDGWIAPRKVCFIAATVRSGSTFFCSAMNETHVLGYPREFFNDAITKRVYPGNKVTARFQATTARLDGTTSNDITSIKFLHHQFPRAERHLRLREWFPDVHWIWIRRADRIAQAVSYEIAMQTSSFTSLNTAKCDPVYSTASIMKRLKQIEAFESAWEEYFAANAIKPLELWYESVDVDADAAMQSISAYVDEPLVRVPVTSKRPNRFSAHARQGTRVNKQWATRFLTERQGYG